MSDIKQLALADVKRVHLNPGDVLVLRVDEIPQNSDMLKPFGALEAVQAFLRDTFPNNRCMILDDKSDVEVVGAPDWDEVTREVARRLTAHAARA